ncbi:MAG TPA: tRNA uridine-5-carboxymethylaminomethyl(34) synthesis enzyme MnmG [Sphaerochaeta sp.]|jgi:tRNA uridine 5-carboxymethylaminomethyl modification enzyme|nr:tRNA uridine-5-carboxymethylaminomethyl(34) synthesis enzyme MnmG [Sphaerochaeta sp.]
MDYDVIVIGGGHAGIEACLAAARIGFKTLLITQSLDAIGRLSCNPAVGGLAKGNLVRETDALGGEMGKLIDATMIQFRILNRARGPAVQAPRAQADKFSYSRLAKETLERQSNLDLFMDTVVDLLTTKNGKTTIGVKTQRNITFTSKAVVLTTGTFMNGRIFIGEYDHSAGRLGEEAAIGLGDALRAKGFNVGRLKTGTPARVRFSSLNLDAMERQNGDGEIVPFSFMHETVDRPSIPCWITYTNENTHDIIRQNIKRSPLYGGKIVGKGPRYCPSIEDKVMRFPDRSRHQVFVEPEGVGTEEMYLNGLSSSLPEDVQHDFIHSVAGLEDAIIMRPAYAVEYDYLDPIQLKPSLESKILENLFVAGQTNGTSGYEEAACQGLMAGINACQKIKGEEPLVLKRTEAYIGVLIDDLVTMGTKEPYRMFTSRAEYRLKLRHDTADERLTQKGYDVGLATEERLDMLRRKTESMESLQDLIHHRGYNGKNALEALKNPDVTMDDLAVNIPEIDTYAKSTRLQLELKIKYDGYIKRQDRQVDRFSKLEGIRIPVDFDYDKVEGISTESREKLKAVRPESIGQASRINGVRTSDVTVLLVYLRK